MNRINCSLANILVKVASIKPLMREKSIYKHKLGTMKANKFNNL
jgi:hypothetical protein